jgi:very-short-patch-repair endonuclease
VAADPRLIEFARQMRHEPTPAEEALWRLLRNRRFAGWKFRRQHPLGLYIADFYSSSAALVVELDGDSHATEEGAEYDRVRHEYLRSLGVEVLRFWNSELKENEDGVLARIFEVCTERQGMRRQWTPQRHRRKRSTDEPTEG